MSSWSEVSNEHEGWKTNKKRRFNGNGNSGGSSRGSAPPPTKTGGGWMSSINSNGKKKREKGASLGGIREKSNWDKQKFKKSITRPSTNPPGEQIFDHSTGRTVAQAVESASINSKVALNSSQRLIVESVIAGESLFYTGPAGTGKSMVLGEIVRLCGELFTDVDATKEDKENLPNGGRRKRIVLTATTGIAACHLGGCTIHSFAGIGTGGGTEEQLLGKVRGSKFAKERWLEADILVIDEVSMMEGGFFDKLEFIGRRIRGNTKPFGGIQVVMTGDFYQLPPVNLSSGFAFEGLRWGTVVKKNVVLTEVFRQKGDQRLIQLLKEARVGKISERSAKMMKDKEREDFPWKISRTKEGGGEEGGEVIEPTRLECKNVDVDKANNAQLDKLKSASHIYSSVDWFAKGVDIGGLKHVPAAEKVELKIGAQVILLKNISPEIGLVNGARGRVVEFQRAGPSGGDEREGNFNRCWDKMFVPVVKFMPMGGGEGAGEDGVVEIIGPEQWTINGGDGSTVIACREQIPLRLAWNLSVHKSQGMTIPNLEVNLRGVFEFGQAYVAMSRGVTLGGLKVKGFDPKCFRAHPRVMDFYDVLEELSGNGKKRGLDVDDGLDDQENGKSSNGNGNGNNSSRNVVPQASTIVGAGAGALNAGKNTKQTKTTLSESQRRRIEENRTKAMKIREEKMRAMTRIDLTK